MATGVHVLRKMGAAEVLATATGPRGAAAPITYAIGSLMPENAAGLTEAQTFVSTMGIDTATTTYAWDAGVYDLVVQLCCGGCTDVRIGKRSEADEK